MILGGAEGTRTPDPHTASVVRYQLRHSPEPAVPRRTADTQAYTGATALKTRVRRTKNDTPNPSTPLITGISGPPGILSAKEHHRSEEIP